MTNSLAALAFVMTPSDYSASFIYATVCAFNAETAERVASEHYGCRALHSDPAGDNLFTVTLERF